MNRTLGVPPPLSEPWVCPKCTGVLGAHKLTCPTLQLQPGWYERSSGDANGAAA